MLALRFPGLCEECCMKQQDWTLRRKNSRCSVSASDNAKSAGGGGSLTFGGQLGVFINNVRNSGALYSRLQQQSFISKMIVNGTTRAMLAKLN